MGRLVRTPGLESLVSIAPLELVLWSYGSCRGVGRSRGSCEIPLLTAYCLLGMIAVLCHISAPENPRVEHSIDFAQFIEARAFHPFSPFTCLARITPSQLSLVSEGYSVTTDLLELRFPTIIVLLLALGTPVSCHTRHRAVAGIQSGFFQSSHRVSPSLCFTNSQHHVTVPAIDVLLRRSDQAH